MKKFLLFLLLAGVLRGQDIAPGKYIRFFDLDASNYVGLQVPDVVSSNYNLLLPATPGSSGEVLTANGVGGTYWATGGGGGGGGATLGPNVFTGNQRVAWAGRPAFIVDSTGLKAGALVAGSGGVVLSYDNSGIFALMREARADVVSAPGNTADYSMYITAAGNVGFGTTTPATKLDVNGTITATGYAGPGTGLTALNASNISSGTVAPAYLGSGTANNTTYLRGDGTWQVLAAGSGDVTGPVSSTTDNLAAWADASGNVLKDAGFALGDVARRSVVNTFAAGQTVEHATNPYLVSSRTASKAIAMSAGSSAGFLSFDSAGDFAIGSATNTNVRTAPGTSETWRMWVKGDTGRVGIGTTTPATALDVNGTVTATGFSGSASGLTGLPAAQLSGTVPTANLGSGTANATTYLRGDGTWASLAAGSGDVVGPASATDGALVTFDGTTGKLVKNSTKLATWTPQTNTTNTWYFNQTVEASIISGTTAIDGDVRALQSGGSGSYVALRNTGNKSGLMRDPNAGFFLYYDNSTGDTVMDNVYTGSAQDLIFKASGVTRMTVKNAGNVGIGTTTPATKLDVNGMVTATGYAGPGTGLTALNGSNISSGTVPAARLGSGTTDSTTYLRGDGTWVTLAAGSGDVTGPASSTADNLAAFNGTTGKIVKDAGFGLSDVARKSTVNTFAAGQTVEHSTNPFFVVSRTSNRAAALGAGTSAGFLSFDSAGDFFIGSAANADVKAAPGTTETWRMAIKGATGRVGIGTTSPATALDVAGTVTATGYAGPGTGLTALDASNISAGTLSTSRYTRTGVRRTVYINAGAMIPRTTAGAAAGSVELATNDIMVDSMDFDSGATDEGVGFWWTPPSSYDGGTVTAIFHWTAASGSGDVIWKIRGRAFANDDAIDQAMGTEVTVTDTLLAANDMHISPTTAAITITSAAANRPTYFQIVRNSSSASDTIAADADLIGVTIEYTESATEPAAQ